MSGVKRYALDIDCIYQCEGGEYVLASDYDRDTQALKDELDNIKRSWGLLHSERDALRAQIEVMRGALERAREVVAFHHVTAGDRFREVELAAIDAALQAKP